jgi:hypothetical protein
MDRETKSILLWVTGCSTALIILICVAMYAYPKYKVYARTLNGEAQLEEARWTKKIRIEEANAHMESAKLLAAAEVERAKGVAESNKIIGDSLKDNEGYLRYLWIMGLQDGSSEVIYIPTEANLPILEARDNRKGK